MLVKSPLIASAVWTHTFFENKIDGVVEGMVCSYDCGPDSMYILSRITMIPYVSNGLIGCHGFRGNWTNF